MNPVFASLIRSVLKVGGGAAVANGLATNDETEAVIGALVTIIGVVWGIVQRRNVAAKEHEGTRKGGGLVGGLVLVGVLGSGCTFTRYSDQVRATNGVPEKVVLTQVSWFNNSMSKGLKVNSRTDKTTTGLSVQTQENQVQADAIKATFEGAGAAFGAGLKAAVGK